jgi:transposase
LARARKRLVEKRTDFKNEVHAILDRQGVSYDWDPFSQAGQERLLDEELLDLSAVARHVLEAFLGVIRELTEQIHQLEAAIEQVPIDREETQRLMTIPGVSYFSSVLILGEIGDIDRFDRAAELVSYAGLDPEVRESGDTRHEGGISKQGRAALRWILVQCANVAVGQADDPYLGSFYGRLKRRKNHQVAIVATARKMLVSIYHMLEREEVYEPPGVTA